MLQRFKKILTDYKETFTVLVGELVVSLLVAAVYLLIGEFDYTVPLGLLLGSGVTVLNIFALSIAVNRRINKFLELRGTREMSEEEADAFAAEHAAKIQLAARASYIVRIVSMVGALALAFVLSESFDVIATVIPLLAYRPIIYAAEFLKLKFANKNIQYTDISDEISDAPTDGGSYFEPLTEKGEDVSDKEEEV